MTATLGDEDTWWKTGLVLGGGYLAGNYYYGLLSESPYLASDSDESQKLLTYNNQGQKLLTYEGINQESQAILKNGYYEVNGFKYSKYYYEKLWNTGRGGSSLVAKEILENSTKITPDEIKIGFFKYIYGNWEMVYNPKTKEIWHIQPK